MYKTLADTAALASHLDDPRWAVVDCRFTLTDPDAGRRAYAAGHIPGAVYAHLNDDLSAPVRPDSGRHPLPDPERLAEMLGRWGIDNDTQVVVYDDSFGAMAARLWWLMHWLGHEACALLDGGMPKWQREQRPITVDVRAPTPRRFQAQVDDALWVDSGFMTQLVAQGGGLIVDARAEERFRGEVEPLDPVAGHVPGAVNLPFEDNLDLGGTFLSAAELRALYTERLAGTPPDRVIQMCGSGVTACHNLLAMAHAGLPGARLYAGSWSEWITEPSRPVVTGE